MEKGTTVGSQKIAALFDDGSFVETGAFVKRADGTPTGVVCGYGAIGGKLVYAFSQDSDRTRGAFDALQAKKIAKLYELAMKNGAPVIGMLDSAGAMLGDGASVMSAYGKLLKVVSDASGVIPQVAIVTGVCSGMSATVAAMFDVVVTIKEVSKLFVNAPFLIGKEVGEAEYTMQSGLASVLAENEADAIAKACKLIELLPSNNEEGVYANENADDENRCVAVEGVCGKALIKAVCDAESFLELGEGFADEMITGFVTFGGVTCGVVANNAEVQSGVITAKAAAKAARLVALCDSFSIPVVTLTDSIGVEMSREAEDNALATQLAKLAMTYASANTAKVTVVTNKAYGAAFTLMGSKALGADMVYALPESVISVMAPASAVAFLWNDKITETVTRADLEAEWTKTCASAEAAACDGSIDDVIAPAELRQRICAAVYMLMMKNGTAPARKHCNLPL